MALDGVFLRNTAKEIEQAALGARVDKIYQPNREEIIVSLRSRAVSYTHLNVFPAGAGVILYRKRCRFGCVCFPRRCGGDPG